MGHSTASRPETSGADRTAPAPTPGLAPPAHSLPAAVAHELANPLIAITQALSVLRGSLREDADLALADCVLAEGRRLRRLVQRAAVAGWRPVRVGDPTSIEPLVHGVVALVRFDPRVPADVHFHLRFSPDLSPVVIDADAITQVLWNVLLNAGQAVERGGHVTVLTEWASEERLVLEVRDDGPGFSGEPDHWARAGASGRAGGSGLGLAVSREIIEAHGGELRLDRSEGGGARVRLWIPRNGPHNPLD